LVGSVVRVKSELLGYLRLVPGHGGPDIRFGQVLAAGLPGGPRRVPGVDCRLRGIASYCTFRDGL